jgi:Fe2+ or Zn2+ uptake regulation protein
MPPTDHTGHHITYEYQGHPAGATDPHHDTVTCRTCGTRIPEEEN